MKKFNSIQGLLLVSLLTFVGCKGSSKGGSAAAVVPGVTVGTYYTQGQVNQGGYNNGGYQQERCEVSANTYNCVNQNGTSTGAISFGSIQEFCNLILNEQRNQGNQGFGNQGVAPMARQNTAQQMGCGMHQGGYNQQYPNNQYPYNPNFPNGQVNPGFPPPNIPGQIPGGYQNGQPVQFKNINCRVIARKGETSGDSGMMLVPVVATGGSTVNLYANIVSQKSYLGGIFNTTNMSTSNKLGKVKMTYIPGAGLDADMIKISAEGVDGHIKTSITGYAGSNVDLEISPDSEFSDETYLSVTCRSADASNPGPVDAKTKYTCTGTEKIGSGKESSIKGKLDYNAELMGEVYEMSQKTNLVTEGSLSTGLGYAQFDTVSTGVLDSKVRGQANITTAVKYEVEKNGYALKVSCRPTAN